MDKPNFVELGSTDSASHALFQVVVDPDGDVEVRILGDDHRWSHLVVDGNQLVKSLVQLLGHIPPKPASVVRLAPKEPA